MSICILGFVFSLRTTFVGVLLAPTVFRVVPTLSTIPTFDRILVLVLALVLVLSVLSVLSLLPFAFALAMLVFALFPFAFAKCTICVTSTLTVCFDFFSQDTIRSQSRTVQLYVFLEIINKASKELMRMSSARLCAFP